MCVLSFFKRKKIIYLAASGLSCGIQGLCCSMQDLLLQLAGSVTLQYVGFKFPDQGLNLHPLNCKG